MENQNIFTNQHLFHTQVLKESLKQEAIPDDHLRILQDWSKNLATLNQQDKASQHTAFLQKILVELLGYHNASGNNTHTLKDMAAPDSYFDAGLGQFEGEQSQVTTLVKLMRPSSFSLDAITEDKKRSLIDLARQHAKKIPDRQFFLLSNLDEIRLYSLIHKRNIFERFSLARMAEDPAEYQRFHLVLNAKNMLSGQSLEWLHKSIELNLQDKLTHEHPTIKDIYGPFNPGIDVGINDAFVINAETYKKLVQEDPKSAKILRPFYAGESLKKWHSDSQMYWLVYTPKGQIDIDAYPAIKKHLLAFKEQLEKRKGDQQWFELDHTDNTDTPDENDLQIGVGRMQAAPGFVLGKNNTMYGNGSYYITNADYFLFGILNSAAISRLLKTLSSQTDNGMYEVMAHHVEALPLPDADGMLRAKLGRLAQFCMETAGNRRDTIKHFHGMTAFNLSPEKLSAKMSDRLINWFAHDFETFRNEVISSFGVDIPADDLQLWSDYFEQEKENITSMSAELAHNERELDIAVYELFELDEDEITLIELS